MISLSAPTYDPAGCLILPGEPRDLYAARRRTTVTATLDGGATVYDTGYSTADRIVRVYQTRPTVAQLEALTYLVAYYSRLVVSMRDGCYEALVEFTNDRAEATITLRLLDILS